MALEKTKENKSQIPENIKKTKRNRRKTECSINRMRGCGNCGSLNIAIQGVKFCNICGTEVEFLTQDIWIWSHGETVVPCDCVRTRINHKGRKVEYCDVSYISVSKCLDCGAVKSSFCPNCKRKRDCWKSFDGKKFCQSCGYRKN